MLKLYIPQEPKPIGRKALPLFLIRKIYSTISILVKLFIPFAEKVGPPEKDLPENSELVEEQRRQCKELFDLSEARLSGLSSRASALFSTVGLLAPLELAAVGFAWKLNVGELPTVVYWMFIASLVFLTLAGVAVIRASNVMTVEQPGIETVIDTKNGKVRDYNSHRDAMCLLWCAMANNAIANRRFDHLRAGTSLVVLSVFMLLCGGVILSTVPPSAMQQQNEKKSRLDILDSRLQTTEKTILILEKHLKSVIVQVESIESKKEENSAPSSKNGEDSNPQSSQ